MKTSKQKFSKKVAFVALFVMSAFVLMAQGTTMITTNPGVNSETEMRIGWHMNEGVSGGFVEYTKRSDATWANAQRVNGTYTLSTAWYDVLATQGNPRENVTHFIRVNRYSAVLTGLEPNTEYMYRVGWNTTFSEIRHFKTAGAKEFTFGWMSDNHVISWLPSRLTNSMNMVSRLVTEAGPGGIDFMLSTGDIVAYGSCYVDWQSLFNHAHFRNFMWVTAIGNHDIYDRLANPIRQEFYTHAHNNPRNGPPGRQEGCTYWFRYGDVLWIVLNTEISHTAAVEAWFRQVVQDNPAQYIFVAQHRQWFNGSGTAGAAGFTRWNRIFDEVGVDIAFSGNDHVYFRTHPLYNGVVSQDPTRGTVYIGAPSSCGDRGRDMPSLNDPNGRIAHRWTEGGPTIGGSLVTVNSEGVTIRLFNRHGVIQDQVTIPSKRSAEPPIPAVVRVMPENLNAVNIQNPIELTFNTRMDRASVESAISLLPAAPLSYAWSNDFTVRINLSQLEFETSYVLTIDGSVAKNVDGDKFLAGDGNGTEGTDYVLNFTTRPDAEIMSGDYFVPNDPGGGQKWFPTLKEAFDAINTQPIDGDVRLWINGNITSPHNVGLINDTDHSITVKSYGGVRHSITFTNGTDPGGPSGSIVIGAGSSLAWNSIAPARNITFDNLTILTSSTSAGNVPIVIIDAASNITIRNCSIRHQPTTGTYAVHIRGVANRSESNIRGIMPANVTLENNEIINIAGGSAQGIGVLGDGTYTTATLAQNLVIRNNIIRARTRGIWVREIDGVSFTGNQIYVRQTSTGMNSMGFYSTAVTGDVYVTGNKFLEMATGENAGTAANVGVRGVYISGGNATYYIDNNYFTGFEKIPTASGRAQLLGIHTTIAITLYIRHNTFYMNRLTNAMTNLSLTPAGSEPSYSAINLVHANTVAHIQNNLFVSNEDRFPNFFIRGNANFTAADNNVFCFQAGTTNARMASGTFPTDLQMVESVEFTNTAQGDLSILAGSSSEKDESLAVPRLPGVLTDIYGTSRYVTTYAGAFEALPFTREIPLNYPCPVQGPNVEPQDEYTFIQLGSTLDAPWLNEDNIQRAIHRNDKLYVLTNAPEPKIFIVNPSTLELIREMDLTGISGGIVTISDIAFTSDGKLLACNRETVPHSSETAANPNFNNVFRMYIWDNDDAAPEVYFEIDRTSVDAATGNWISGTIGATMAVSGPSWHSTIYMPAYSGVSLNYRIVGIVYEEGKPLTASFRMRDGAVNGTGGNNFNETADWGSGFQFMISPLADDAFIVTSNTIQPTEYQFDWNLVTRSNLPMRGVFAAECGYELFRTNGVNYFCYADRFYMAAPVAQAGRVSAGVVLFDITDGLDNAVKISEKVFTTDFGTNPAPYMMAYGVVDNEDIILGLLAENQGFARFITGVGVGISVPTHRPEIRVYPNPILDIVHIESDFAITAIKLFDLTGRLIMNVPASQTSVDMSGVAAGNYILFVNDIPIRVIKR